MRADGERRETGHDERFTPRPGGDRAIERDRRRSVVVREEQRQRSHVAIRAVRVLGSHGDLLGRALTIEYATLRIDVESHAGGNVGGVLRAARRNPVHHGLAEFRFSLEAFAARVGNNTDRLLDHQAGLGDGEVDAPTGHFARDAEIVPIGIESKQRQPEAVLAPSRPVATSRVATGLHPDRHDIQFEADRPGLRRSFHLHRNREHLPAELDLQFGLPVGGGIERRPFAATEGRIGKRPRRLFAHVARDAIGVNGLHDDKLPILGRREIHVGRIDVELHQRRLSERCRSRDARHGPHKARCQNRSPRHVAVLEVTANLITSLGSRQIADRVVSEITVHRLAWPRLPEQHRPDL